MADLTNRQRKILLLLTQTEKCTGHLLAKSLNISLRTLQNEIQIINRIHKSSIIFSDNKGYSLIKDSQSLINYSLFSNENRNDTLHDIIKNLLLKSESLNVDDLADSLYISISTLTKLLNKVQIVLDDYNLSLTRQKNCIQILGSEFEKRRLIKHLIYYDAEPVFINIEACANYFDNMDIIRIKDIILSAVQLNDCYIEDCYYNGLMINIIVALYRMRNGKSIDQIKTVLSIDKSTEEYKIAYEICKQYSMHCSLVLNEEDIEYISVLLNGQLKSMNPNQKLGNTIHGIDESFSQHIKNILHKTFNYYMLNIDYESFLKNFILHVDALIKRAQYSQYASNTITENIKLNCPFIYDVSVYLAKQIEDTFNIIVTDEEIGYISVHIGFLIENSTRETNKVKILLICENYHQIKEIIISKLIENYKNDIEIVNSITDFKNYNLDSKEDLILTTITIPIIGKKVIQISPFYTMMDNLKIEQAIHHCQEELIRKKEQKLLLSLFNEELFFINSNLRHKEEVIRFLGQKVIDFGIVNEGFVESVLKREEMSSTCFFDTFSIPHAIELDAKKTMFCVLVNPNGINWDNQQIHLVFMITVHQKDRKEFMKIYNGIIQTLCQREKVESLIKSSSLVDFIDSFTK